MTRSLGLRSAGGVLALAGACLWAATAAQAGGYDTGERDWDFLFQSGTIAAEASVRYIDPQRTLKDVAGVNLLAGATTASVREAEAFTVARLSATARIAENLRCMASYRQPWEGHANYGSAWAAAPSATEQHFSSDDVGLTCALSKRAGIGNLLFIGGLSYERIDYELTQSLVGPVVATTSVGDSGIGWRAGFGYEIPQYALRATLIYNSAIDYDMTGTGSLLAGGFYSGPVFGSMTMPQSLELKVQSGVAPGWLAFGALKWTDWSVAQNMPICAVGTPVCIQSTAISGLTLLFRDSWTATIGAAHQFSKQFSLAGSVTWDQGASEGFTSQTDTWNFGLTAIIDANPRARFMFGGTLGVLTAGSESTAVLADGSPNPVGYTASFGNDLVYSLSASATLHY